MKVEAGALHQKDCMALLKRRSELISQTQRAKSVLVCEAATSLSVPDTLEISAHLSEGMCIFSKNSIVF